MASGQQPDQSESNLRLLLNRVTSLIVILAAIAAIVYLTRDSLSDRWILIGAIGGAVILGVSFPIVSQVGSGIRFWRWMDLRLRPQVFVAVMLLGAVAALVILIDQAANEIAAGAVGGIVALAKDIINTEDEPSTPVGTGTPGGTGATGDSGTTGESSRTNQPA